MRIASSAWLVRILPIEVAIVTAARQRTLIELIEDRIFSIARDYCRVNVSKLGIESHLTLIK